MPAKKPSPAASLSRLVAYGAAASAAASSTASADVIYFNPADVITPTSGARFIYFNPRDGAVATSPQSGEEGAKYQFVLQGGAPPIFEKASLFRNAGFPNNDGLTLRTAVGAPGSQYIARLGAGAAIGNGGIFAATPNSLAFRSQTQYGGFAYYGNWNSFGTGYFGFSFGMPDGVHYGWGQINIASDYRITLLDFAYESTPGMTIAAGQITAVPEPATSSLVALALGASGIAAYRARRRRAQAAA